MITSKLITDSRLQINAVGDDFFTDAEIVEYLNRGVDKLQTDLIRIKSSDIARLQIFSTVIGQGNYWLNNYIGGIISSGDLLDIIGIWRTDDSTPIPLGNLEQQDYTTFGYGQIEAVYTRRPINNFYYTFSDIQDNGNHSDVMTISPTPTTADSYNLWYWKKIPYFSVSQLSYEPTWLATPFHDLISLRASIRMLEKDDRPTDKKEQRFTERLQEYKDFLKQKRSNQMSYTPRP